MFFLILSSLNNLFVFVYRSIDDPLVDNDSTCVAGLHELKKHKELKRRQKDTMGLEAYHHYKWVRY